MPLNRPAEPNRWYRSSLFSESRPARPEDDTQLATQLQRNAVDYLGGTPDIGRPVGTGVRELFISCEIGDALQQQFEHVRPSCIALHDLGCTVSRRLLAAVAAASGQPVERLVIRRAGFGTTVATIEYVDCPAVNGPPVRLFSTDADADSQSRLSISRVLLSHATLGAVLLGDLPGHALVELLEPMRASMQNYRWQCQQVLFLPLGQALVAGNAIQERMQSSAVPTALSPRVTMPADAWGHLHACWNELQHTLYPGSGGAQLAPLPESPEATAASAVAPAAPTSRPASPARALPPGPNPGAAPGPALPHNASPLVANAPAAARAPATPMPPSTRPGGTPLPSAGPAATERPAAAGTRPGPPLPASAPGGLPPPAARARPTSPGVGVTAASAPGSTPAALAAAASTSSAASTSLRPALAGPDYAPTVVAGLDASGVVSPAPAPLQSFVSRLAGLDGVVAVCLFEVQTSRVLAHAGARNLAADLARRGTTLLAASNQARKQLDLAGGADEVVVRGGVKALVVRPLMAQPAWAVHLVFTPTQSDWPQLRAQLLALDQALQRGPVL